MGWLDWAPSVALAADVNLVILALDGKSELLSMIYGSGKKDRRRKGKVTGADFKSFAARHNGRIGSDG